MFRLTPTVPTTQTSWWYSFTHPQKVYRDNEPFLIKEAKMAGAALTGVALVASTQPVLNTATVTLRMPNALGQVYKSLWQAKKVGPNLKLLGTFLAPAAAILAIPFTTVGSALWGLGSGGVRGVDYGPLGALGISFRDTAWMWDHGSWEMLDEATKDFRTEELRPGEEPIDIKILESARGLVAGVTSVAIMVPAISIATFLRVPQALAKIWFDYLSEEISKHPILAPVGATLMTAGVPLAVALSPFASALFALGRGTYDGYKKGFFASIDKSIQTISDYWKETGELLKPD